MLSGVESVSRLDIVDVCLDDQLWADDAHVPEDEVIGTRRIFAPGGEVNILRSCRPIPRMEASANESDDASEVEIARKDLADERRRRDSGFVLRDEVSNSQ